MSRTTQSRYPPNVKFSYLYRDASNYKRHAAVIFCNSGAVPIGEIGSIIQLVLGPAAPFPDVLQFDAEAVGLPAVSLYESGMPTADDLEFHEFVSVEETDAPPNDSLRRSISQFLRELASVQEGLARSSAVE